MVILASIAAYILIALATEYVAARLGREMMGLGFIWPVSIPFGLLFMALQFVGDIGRDRYWHGGK